jgi:hypothetical protein
MVSPLHVRLPNICLSVDMVVFPFGAAPGKHMLFCSKIQSFFFTSKGTNYVYRLEPVVDIFGQAGVFNLNGYILEWSLKNHYFKKINDFS